MSRIFRLVAAFAALFLAGEARAAELRMDRAVCEYVTKHVPDAGVAYEPGVDATGRRVVPADLEPADNLEDQVVIRLTNDAARVWGLRLPAIRRGRERVPLAEAETNIGLVTLHNGKAYLNGQPLDADKQDELAVLCLHKK